MPATTVHERRSELQLLMSTAPADHRKLVERLTVGDVGSAVVHEHLVAAVNAQDERRDWIVANWPHVVELEQLNALIAAQPALAHWPAATPPAVQAVLDAMASAASPPPSREHRTLAALDHEATVNDPVRQAQARVHDLDQLAARASTSAEQAALHEALRAARLELRQARREQRVDDVFARYGIGAHDDACERRRLTVGHDVLTDPPDWVVEHLRRLHDDGRLGATRSRRSGYPDRGGRGTPRPAWSTFPTAGPSSACVQPPARYPSSISRYPGRDPGSRSGGDP